MTPRGVYPLVDASNGVATLAGTVFCTRGQRIVTCAHVLEAVDCYADVRPPERGAPFIFPDSIYLSGVEQAGHLAHVEWRLHPKPEVDIAVGVLAEPRLPHIEPDFTVLKPGEGGLQCAGYLNVRGGLQVWERSASGYDGVRRWVALDGTVARGVSGGPVLRGDRVIGVVWADHAANAQSYIVPVAWFWDWWEKIPHTSGGDGDGGEIVDLTSYPITPMIRFAEIPEPVIDFYVESFGDIPSSLIFFERAMHERLQANPENFGKRQIVVQRADIANLDKITVRSFWNQVFEFAGLKSRRTVAALLESEHAPNPQFMHEDSARRALADFKKFLRNPSQR